MDTAADGSRGAPSTRPSAPPGEPAAVVRNPARGLALSVVLLLVLLFALSVLMERSTPSTDQAVVQGYVVPMAAEVSGRVIEVGVFDNSRVAGGQMLFRIDPQPYRLAIAEAEARLEQVGLALGASTASVDAAQAQVVAARAERDNVREQARRVMQLVERGVYAQARYDQARAGLDASAAALSKAVADLQRARKELGPAGNANPQLKEALAKLEKSRLDLARTSVRAPGDGVVTNLQLSVGQVVSPAQPALTFISAGSIWVSAAFKENSLEHMQAGDKAELVFDILPGRVFAARVESVGWGVAHSAMDGAAALPTIRNQSGWVREPQRFPVRLVFTEPLPKGLRHGSLAQVVVYTGDNPLLNVVGAGWTRLLSVLSYAH